MISKQLLNFQRKPLLWRVIFWAFFLFQILFWVMAIAHYDYITFYRGKFFSWTYWNWFISENPPYPNSDLVLMFMRAISILFGLLFTFAQGYYLYQLRKIPRFALKVICLYAVVFATLALWTEYVLHYVYHYRLFMDLVPTAIFSLVTLLLLILFDRDITKRFLLKLFFGSGCIVQCVLIASIFISMNPTQYMVPRQLSQSEIDHYTQFTIALPDDTAKNPSSSDVLAYCVLDEEVLIGDNQYSLYTSDTLAQYIYLCDSIREISQHQYGSLSVEYFTHDGEEVTLSIGPDGIVGRDIYDKKTDAYYGLHPHETIKYLHLRHPVDYTTPLTISAVGVGIALVAVLYFIVKGKKVDHDLLHET